MEEGGKRLDQPIELAEYVVSRDQLATPYSWCASNGDFNANLDMLGARLGAMLDYRSYSLSSPSLSR